MKIYEEMILRVRDPKEDTMEAVGDLILQQYPAFDILHIEKKKGYWEVKVQEELFFEEERE